MSSTTETFNTNYPLSPLYLNTSNIGYIETGLVAINNSSSVSNIQPYTTEPTGMFGSINIILTYKPYIHTPYNITYTSMNISQVLKNLLPNYSDIELIINNSLVKYNLGTDIKLSIATNQSIFLNTLENNTLVYNSVTPISSSTSISINNNYAVEYNQYGVLNVFNLVNVSNGIYISQPIYLPNTPISLSNNTVYTNNGYIYSIGGTTSIYYIKAATPTSWKTNPTQLPNSINNPTIVGNNSYIYILTSTSIYSSNINSTGSLSNISLSSVSLPENIDSSLITILGNNLVLVSNSTTYISNISSIGTLSAFTNLSVNTPTLSNGSITAWNNFIYYFGLDNNNVVIYQSYLDNNTLTDWVNIDITLPINITPITITTIDNILVLVYSNTLPNLSILTFYLEDNNIYTLTPSTSFTALPTGICLLEQLQASAGIATSTSNLPLTLSSRSFNNGVVVNTYNPTTVDINSESQSLEYNNGYFSLSNFNPGDIITNINVILSGSIEPPTVTSTTTSTVP